ncbi:MAG: J domain-containing protein [Desulfobaccales bacterium]
MQDFKRSCQILGLDAGASRAEIKQAYRDLVHVWHPDRFAQNPRLQTKAEAKLKEINVAYEQVLAGFRPAAATKTTAAAPKSKKQPPPSSPEPPPGREGGFRYRPRQNLRQTILNLQKTIRQNPGNAAAHYNLAMAYLHLNRNQEALETFQKAVSLAPDAAAVHAGRGVAYSRLGKNLQALSAFRRALLLKPADALTHLNLGITYRRLGRHHRGRLAIIEAIRLEPDYPEAHYELGLANLSLHNRASALEEYKVLLNLNQKLAYKLFGFIYKL